MPKRRESPFSRVNPSGKRVWVARYTGPDGRRRSAATFTTKREAQDAIDRAYRVPVRRDTVGAYFGGREKNGRDDGSDWTDRLPRSERTDRTNRGRRCACWATAACASASCLPCAENCRIFGPEYSRSKAAGGKAT